jgi:hypothetical protein
MVSLCVKFPNSHAAFYSLLPVVNTVLFGINYIVNTVLLHLSGYIHKKPDLLYFNAY